VQLIISGLERSFMPETGAPKSDREPECAEVRFRRPAARSPGPHFQEPRSQSCCRRNSRTARMRGVSQPSGTDSHLLRRLIRKMSEMQSSRLLHSVLLAILLLPPAAAAQETGPSDAEYASETGVLYHTGSNLTEYMKRKWGLDVYYPTNVPKFATVVWFHGGGLKGGIRSVPDGLKDRGFAVVTAGYRLSQEIRSSAYNEDAAAAVARKFRNIESRGGSGDCVFVAGFSAGGYLTGMIGLDRQWLAAHSVATDCIAASSRTMGRRSHIQQFVPSVASKKTSWSLITWLRCFMYGTMCLLCC